MHYTDTDSKHVLLSRGPNVSSGLDVFSRLLFILQHLGTVPPHACNVETPQTARAAKAGFASNPSPFLFGCLLANEKSEDDILGHGDGTNPKVIQKSPI